MKRPRILIADDHPPMLRIIHKMLAPHYEISGTVADGRALVEAALRLKPDLIVVDITMPLLNGIDAAIQIKASLPGMKLLFVTMHSNAEYIIAALDAGGTGYVLKSAVCEDLLDAVQSVLGGCIYISPSLSTKSLNRLDHPAQTPLMSTNTFNDIGGEAVASAAWKVSGQYYETCSCKFGCPWILSLKPSKGSCTFAMAFQIERGSYGSVSLDGLGFIVLGWMPEAMAKGNWKIGLLTDERASTEQREAITTIASGSDGGPMAALTGLIGTFLGVESAPIRFDRNGATWAVKAAGIVDMEASAAMGLNPAATEPLHLDNTGHPASDRIALAHTVKSHVHTLGLSWDDVSGKNNGQYAPFAWQSA